MIKEKLLALWKKNRTAPSSDPMMPLRIREIHRHSPGRDLYLRERSRILLTLKPGPGDPEGVKNKAFVFEQFSFDAGFLLCLRPPGEITLLSEKGFWVTLSFIAPAVQPWSRMLELCNELLSYTTKRDDFPLTGFGHATFFFVQGRNIYINRKHIPLMEKESNGFHELHIQLLKLRDHIMDLV